MVTPLAALGAAAIVLATLARATIVRREDLASRALASTPRERDHSLLLLLLAAILASPLGWVYYLPLAYAPMLGWLGAADGWSRLRELRWPQVTVLVAALALLYVPQEVANSGQPSRLATLTLASSYFFGTALLWSCVWRSGRLSAEAS
jgi:hypothetical protein